MIALDRGGLVLEGEAAAKSLAALWTPYEAARSEVQQVKAALRTAERDAELHAIVEQLKSRDDWLVAKLARFNSISPPGVPAWGASSALRDALRTLAARRCEI